MRKISMSMNVLREFRVGETKQQEIDGSSFQEMLKTSVILR